jgi:hypothetical protein
MTNHVEEIKEKLGHIIKEETNRRTKKVAIKRRQCYECHEYGLLARACPTLDNEECASIDDPSSSTQVHMCLMANGSKVMMSTHASILVDSVGPPSAEVCRAAASFP